MLTLFLMALFTNDIHSPLTTTCSWYGEAFHGRSTASGRVFDMYELTCAHCTLPQGSIIAMRSLTTGIEIDSVWVTDTGPWRYDSTGHAIFPLQPHAVRKFDLSKAVFDSLSNGNLNWGIMDVEWKVVGRNTEELRYY